MATNGTKLTDQERKRLTGPVLSSAFDAYDRLFPGFKGGDVFAYDWDARQLKEMLARSGKARSVEQVLTLPLRSAKWEIKGPGEIGDFVRRVLADKLNLVIDQMTAAATYKKAFFELVWSIDGGRVVLDEVAWRPPTSCEAAFDDKTGRPNGFRQRVAHPGGETLPAEGRDTLPGYVRIPASRAFVYTHGVHREPLFGTSDMDVAHWCYETQQKLLFLWFQYLERQALPNVIAYGADRSEADANADTIAEMRSGGVLGMTRMADPQAKVFELLESSGKGADQFIQAVRYLDEMMPASVLAGFTELATAATGSGGSYALSADQSEFFLSSRQAVADEMADAITNGLIRPLVVYNYGPQTEYPRVEIGPLANKDTDRAFTLLQSIITAPSLQVPDMFVGELVKSTSSYLGLEEKTIAAAVDEFARQQAAKRERQARTPQGVPDAAKKLGDAVQAAASMVATGETG
ncbi:phage portal protein family protein [Saccharopolyspora sp. NPDC002376]